MNADLLSQNLILILCSLFTAITVFLITRLFVASRKVKKRARLVQTFSKANIKMFSLALIGNIIAALLIKLVVAHQTDSPLPASFLFMVMPLTISITLLVFTLRFKKHLWMMAASCALVSLVFSLVIINDYYRFYPTIGELFNENSNVTQINQDQRGIFVNFSGTKLNNTHRQSIEAELNAVNGKSTTGKVYTLNIPGTVSKFKARGAYVYVPAIYSKLTDTNFPVIVLTAGYPGIPENWLGSGLENTMDEFARSHEGITPLVFMVDNTGSLTNDTECVNSPRGNVETYLTGDVPSYIKSHFRVINNPSNWAIGGLSMGGMCSIMLTLRHPNVYHYFMDYGGEIGPEVGPQQKTIDALFNGSESAWAAHQPSILLATRNYNNLGLGGFFGDGDQDSRIVTQAITELSTDSQKAGIQTVSETISGPHTFEVWQQLFKDSLPWVSNRIGATECNAVCT